MNAPHSHLTGQAWAAISPATRSAPLPGTAHLQARNILQHFPFPPR